MAINIFGIIFKIFYTTSFIITSIVMILIAFVFYVTIRPFNRTVYRSILWYLLLLPYAHVAFMSEWWSLLKLNLYMNKEDFEKYFSKEHALIIVNHSYDIDWVPLISICARTNLLCSIRIFVKKALQYIPIIGWSFILTEYILLYRSYEKDKKIIKDSVRDFANYPYPIWLVLYPEGTWFTKKAQRKSIQYAEEMKLPQLNYHLQPRTTGFTTTVREMRGHIKAIYNIEIAFEKGEVKPCTSNIIDGKQVSAHMYIKRIPEEEIPTEKEQQEIFLRNMFQIKDKLQNSFNETGCFFKTSDVPAETLLKIERPFYIILLFLLSCAVVISFIFYWAINFYIANGFAAIFIVIIIITLCFLILTIAVRSTEIEDV